MTEKKSTNPPFVLRIYARSARYKARGYDLSPRETDHLLEQAARYERMADAREAAWAAYEAACQELEE